MSTPAPDPSNIGRTISYTMVKHSRDGSRTITRTARIIDANSVIYRVEHTDFTPADREYTGRFGSVSPSAVTFG